MAKLKVLVEGYARKTAGGWEASSTAVLLEDSGKRIVVDPGCNERMLLEALGKEMVSPGDVDLVFLTHCHLDHLLNVRLFPGVDVADARNAYRGDEEFALKGRIPGTGIRIIDTPGHVREHSALLAETGDGVVAVAGDLWWWREGMQPEMPGEAELLSLEDHIAEDKEMLVASRKAILAMADLIVPGHGKPFRVEK
ncbi:MAG: MBL fold metallo-hydrolase [Candidatus ainarchaeum sp.]|nr:MBL fold metallo-hydrolase [Candidatus ainarchaeum sp.]